MVIIFCLLFILLYFLAPHTIKEKSQGEKAPPGFPSIQYILPLFLNAVFQKRLTMEQLVDRFYNNPRRIFGLPEQKKTYIEVFFFIKVI